MVMRDFGSSLPRNFSSALPTSSLLVMMQASPFDIRSRDLCDPNEQQIYYKGSWRKCEPRDEGGDLSFSLLPI
jgi:hypothetical protein